MKRSFLRFVLWTGFIALPLMHLSCKKSDKNPAPGNTSTKINIATSASLGKYLTDKNGHALYIFSNDYMGRNSCSGGCASIWPLFYAGAITQDSLGTGLNLADFDTIRVNGVPQTRYKGWPLYYYSPSGGGAAALEPSGQTSGDGINGIWFVAKPDYTIMLANGQLLGQDGKDYTGSYMQGMGNTIYFTDARGATLYTFSVDSLDMNEFTKSDFSNNAVWPIYDTTQIVVPSVLDKSMFSVISVYGHSQLAYKGWPLYHFGQDMGKMGSNMGISFPVPGKWPVAVQNMTSPPKPASSTSSTY